MDPNGLLSSSKKRNAHPVASHWDDETMLPRLFKPWLCFPQELGRHPDHCWKNRINSQKKNSQWFQWNLVVVYHWRNKHLWIIMNLWIFDGSCSKTFDFPGRNLLITEAPQWLPSEGLQHWNEAPPIGLQGLLQLSLFGWSKTSYTMRRSSDLHEPIWRWETQYKCWNTDLKADELKIAEVLTDPKFQWHGKLT